MKYHVREKEVLKNPEEYTELPINTDYLINTAGRIYDKVKERYCKISASKLGYYQVSIRGSYREKNNRAYALHRLIALTFINNPENKPCIDHISKDKTDNSIENLRWCTRSENQRNITKRKNKTSKFMGVSLTKYKKWYAQISYNKKVYALGFFETELEAAQAYNKVAIENGFYHINNLESI